MKKVMTLAVLLVMALTASAKGGDLNIVNGSLNAFCMAAERVLHRLFHAAGTRDSERSCGVQRPCDALADGSLGDKFRLFAGGNPCCGFRDLHCGARQRIRRRRCG